MLDDETGGHFRIAAVSPEVRRRQMYLPDSNVLLTRFLTPEGVGEVVDFMPIHERDGGKRAGGAPDHPYRARRARRDPRPAGVPAGLRLRRAPRIARTRRRRSAAAFVGDGVALNLADDAARARSTRTAACLRTSSCGRAKRSRSSSSHGGRRSPGAARTTSVRALPGGVSPRRCGSGRSWIAREPLPGALAGDGQALLPGVEAPDLRSDGRDGGGARRRSLPEHIGGSRNWDYRYTWVRDAAFTVYAFLRVGFDGGGASSSSSSWNGGAATSEPTASLQVLYGIDGRTDLPGSRPRPPRRATEARGRCAPATTPRASSSSTSSAT